MGQVIEKGAWRAYMPTALLLAALLVATIAVLAGDVAGTGEEVPDLTVPNAAYLVLIGLAAGVLGGIIGTGGCSVMLPAIHFWMGYPASVAVGTTLFAVIFTALSGGYGHLIRRNVDRRATLWLGGAGIAGVGFGSWLFTVLADQAALLGLVLGVAFLWPALRMSWEGTGLSPAPVRQGDSIPEHRWGFATFGGTVGVLTGLVGLGGGYALVPGLIYLFGAPIYITMGTSLATMIPLALVGGSVKLVQGYVAVGAGLLLAMGAVVGAQFGAAAIKRFKPNTLKLVFGLYFLYVAVKFITAYFGIRIW